MDTLAPSPLPRWLRSSSVAWAGALLAAVACLLTAGFLWHEKRAIEAGELQSAELYARVLQDHAERTFNTADMALASLTDSAASEAQSREAGRFSADLLQAQHGLPFLRSLSLMTPEGRILSSSSQANVGVLVDLKLIPLPPEGTTDTLGGSVNGRDLTDVQAGQPPPSSALRSFLPLVRRVPVAPGQWLFLVAVLNADFFANEYELALADPTRDAGIFTIHGVLIAATGSVQKAPGDSIASHPFFTAFLPSRESGSFIGPGIDGTRVVTAFRVLRKRPLVIVVERHYAHLVAGFGQTALWALSVCAGSLLVLGTMMVLAWRSLKGHEVVRVALERTRADVAHSERNLRQLVESVHELVFRADPAGLIVFVNARWTAVSGRPVEDIVGRRLAHLCPPGERAACDALFTAHGPHAQTILVHLDGRKGLPLTLELSVALVSDRDGTTLGFAGFAVDVSEREAAEQALQSQLKFTAQLLEMSPTPMFVKDVHGRFVTVNRAWLALMNLSLPQVLGRDSSDLFGSEAPLHQQQDARLDAEDHVSYENQLVIAGRPPRDTVVTKVRFTRADGSPAGIIGSVIDVTEFRQAERSIREARDAAELANSVKSEFIANISHELRTPLQGIIGFSELGRDLATELPDFMDMFNDIHVGGRRMLTLVNGLLDVAQMDSAAGSLTLRRRDLAHLVREAASQLQPKAQARDQSFRLVGLDNAITVDVDPVRLQQALRNVLANAVRYAPRGTAIDIHCVDRGQAGIELCVRDRGPGIPEDELETIFESFVQSSRTRDGSGGTGLGLTIARKILSAHGGTIVAANAADGGALLKITLPAAAHERPAPTLAAGPPAVEVTDAAQY